MGNQIIVEYYEFIEWKQYKDFFPVCYEFLVWK